MDVDHQESTPLGVANINGESPSTHVGGSRLKGCCNTSASEEGYQHGIVSYQEDEVNRNK